MSIGQYTGVPSGMTGIRKYLNDQGYKDDQITYGNGTVSLNGRSLINAMPEADGSTYASAGALQNALKQYNSSNNSAMANNLNNTMYNNVTQQPFQFKQQQSPFSYDPNSDQAYQAALKSAQQNIQTGQNNTLANLLAHGQGNSSYAATAAQQIANKEMGNVSNNILPSLIQQAYQRYQDQNNNDYRNQAANYGTQQDQFKNQSALSSYFNGLGQQDIDNQYRDNTFAEAQKQNNYDAYLKSVGLTGDLGTGPKSDYSLLGGLTGGRSLQGQQYDDNRADTKFEQDYKTRSLDSTIADRNADNARLNASPSKQQQASVKSQETQKKKMDDEKQGLIAAVTDPENPMQYSAAKKKIEDDLRVGFYTQEEAAELLATLEKWANSAYATRYQ